MTQDKTAARPWSVRLARLSGWTPVAAGAGMHREPLVAVTAVLV